MDTENSTLEPEPTQDFDYYEHEEKTNGTFNIFRTILMGLCANFNEYEMPVDAWSCELRPDEYYRLRSLKGKTLQVTTLEQLPLSGVRVDDNGVLRGTGIAFDLLHEIQDKIGFHYNITLPEENTVGSENHGIIRMLKDKEVDMAVTFIPIMPALHQKIAFSVGLANFEWVLFMTRPIASANGSGLLAPFQGTVWLLILISLIIAGPTMYLIVYLRVKFTERNKFLAKPYTLSACFWFVYGALMKQGSVLNPVYDSARLFFATWWIFITILTSFYTANLTAFLTLSHFTLTIQTTKDIYTNRRNWIADKGGYEETLINIENNFEYLKETIPKYGAFTADSLTQRLQRIMKGDIYVTEKRRAEEIIIQDYLNKTRHFVRENKRCTYVLTPKPIVTNLVGFGYQKGSKLKPVFDPMLLNFVNGGIITHLLQKELPRTAVCPLDLSNRERKLLNADLATTYYVVFLGFGISLIIFLGEIINRCCKSKRKKPQLVKQTQGNHFKSTVNGLSKIMSLNNNKWNSSINDDFVVQAYYKEIMPYKYYNDHSAIQEKYFGSVLPDMKSKNVLFQYNYY